MDTIRFFEASTLVWGSPTEIGWRELLRLLASVCEQPAITRCIETKLTIEWVTTSPQDTIVRLVRALDDTSKPLQVTISMENKQKAEIEEKLRILAQLVDRSLPQPSPQWLITFSKLEQVKPTAVSYDMVIRGDIFPIEYSSVKSFSRS